MERPSLDKPAPAAAEPPRSRQIASNRQAESSVVTETDFAHRFPVSRIRWRPPAVPVGD